MTYNRETKCGGRIIVHVEADFKALLPGFVKDWQEEISAMREALENNDYGTIRKIAHDMKGIGGSCGLDDITNLGSSLSESAKAKDADLIRRNLDRLSEYLKRVEFVYE
jgi:HPt (histidine-containing phosphotransfer) domain-containing protein